MDEQLCLDKILQLLKQPQSGKKLVHILTALRKYVNGANHQRAIEKIKSSNMLKQIISFTQFDNNLRVVDLSLSILGNCCMNASVVHHVVNDLNILQNLLRVLDKQKKDSIQGRVFRINGNICDAFEPFRLMQKEAKVITITISFLKEYAGHATDEVIYSVPTVSMALRYIRKMLSILTYSSLARDYKLISTIGMVLIKCSNNWRLKQEDDVLITDILKILQIITSASYKYINLIQDLKSTSKGDALQSLGEIILIEPERITKIILRLAKISKNLSDLPIETIITILITQVEEQGSTTNGSQKLLLACVSNLIDHLGFQDMFKNANIVKTLIKLLDSYSSQEDWAIQCCIYICQSLNKCKYNEELVNSQMSTNIIPLIITKLEIITGKSTGKITIKSHTQKVYKEESTCKRLKTSEDENFRVMEFDKTFDRCASPSSCSDISSCGPFSPAATSNFTGEDSDSDNYSPLCSETECDEEYRDENVEQELIPSDTDDKELSYTQDQMELRCKLRTELCSLLKLYCTVKPLHNQLGDVKVITLIINLLLDSFINEESNEREFFIINAITLSHHFLIPFMMSDLLLQIYQITDGAHDGYCSDCETLSARVRQIIDNFVETGSSNGIKGDIAYILLGKDNAESKLKLVTSIPFVIRNKATLVKLLVDYNGLNLLTNRLKQEPNAELHYPIIKSLSTLAMTQLKIRNPFDKSTNSNWPTPGRSKNARDELKIGPYTLPDKCENVVTFLLDDGSLVEADRDWLKGKSDYFSALLSGSFVESQSNEVKIKDVSCAALKCLLEILKQEFTHSTYFRFDYKIETILEVLLLSDRFLLNNLTSAMLRNAQHQISSQTVATIYKWSLSLGNDMLRIECAVFALGCKRLTRTQVNELFTSLYNTGYASELIDDIIMLIYQFL